MSRKFRVGDMVKANKKSNDEYCITTEKNDCVCRVTSVYRGSDIEVQITSCNDESEIESCFWVDEEYFDLFVPKTNKIYLASPFFDEDEIERVNKVKEILRDKGLEVFVPMEHQSPELEFGSREWRDKTFKNDVEHIDLAGVVVAIISKGNYDDSGTAWELGYAYATNKPVILVNLTGETINLMIADSLHALITSYEELKDYDFNKLEKIEYTNYVW